MRDKLADRIRSTVMIGLFLTAIPVIVLFLVVGWSTRALFAVVPSPKGPAVQPAQDGQTAAAAQ
jgi:hypothetical protein